MNLPSEILLEIFSRLPITSLHRFRCVSSFFGSLKYGHYFQKKHLELAVPYSNLESKRWLLGISYFLPSKQDPTIGDVFSLSNVCYFTSDERVYASKYMRSYYFNVLCSSINGLFCVDYGYRESDTNIFLWNPTINEFKRLPYSFYEVDAPDIIRVYSCYGLGYDSSYDDYVVVRLTMFTHSLNDMIHRSNEVKVYSLRTDSWRLINPFPYDIGERNKLECQFVNNRFHWMVRCVPPVIVSLSLSNYEYKDVPQPNYRKVPNLEYLDDIEIVVIDGMLCVFCNYVHDSFDLWMMKKYGIQESWMMMLSITFPNVLLYGRPIVLNNPSDYLKFYPLYLFDNGDILLEWRAGMSRDIVTYNKDEKILVTTLVDNPSVEAGGEIYEETSRCDIYTETLISPNSFKGIGL